MKLLHTLLVCLLLILFSNTLFAEKKDSLKISGFAEVYYSSDQHTWAEHTRPDFMYNHTSSRYIALNSAVLNVDYASERLHASIALVEGTYANRITSLEKDGFGSLYTANISFLPFKNKKHEIRAGIFPSHIGLESAIGLNNICLTRSIAAENTPYYESGISFTFHSNDEKFTGSFLVLNGWQNMNMLAQENRPSFGTQFVVKPKKNLLINFSSFAGEVVTDNILRKRAYEDFYIDFKASDRLHLQAQCDFGFQRIPYSHYLNSWATATLMAGLKLNEHIGLGGRIEMFNDEKHQIITSSVSELMGFSFNVNYSILPNLLFRAEFRNLQSQNVPFQFATTQSSHINGLNLSLAAQF